MNIYSTSINYRNSVPNFKQKTFSKQVLRGLRAKEAYAGVSVEERLVNTANHTAQFEPINTKAYGRVLDRCQEEANAARRFGNADLYEKKRAEMNLLLNMF